MQTDKEIINFVSILVNGKPEKRNKKEETIAEIIADQVVEECWNCCSVFC
jgi:hypothetical protein